MVTISLACLQGTCQFVSLTELGRIHDKMASANPKVLKTSSVRHCIDRVSTSDTQNEQRVIYLETVCLTSEDPADKDSVVKFG